MAVEKIFVRLFNDIGGNFDFGEGEAFFPLFVLVPNHQLHKGHVGNPAQGVGLQQAVGEDGIQFLAPNYFVSQGTHYFHYFIERLLQHLELLSEIRGFGNPLEGFDHDAQVVLDQRRVLVRENVFESDEAVYLAVHSKPHVLRVVVDGEEDLLRPGGDVVGEYVLESMRPKQIPHLSLEGLVDVDWKLGNVVLDSVVKNFSEETQVVVRVDHLHDEVVFEEKLKYLIYILEVVVSNHLFPRMEVEGLLLSVGHYFVAVGDLLHRKPVDDVLGLEHYVLLLHVHRKADFQVPVQDYRFELLVQLSQTDLFLQGLKSEDFVLAQRHLSSFVHQAFRLLSVHSGEFAYFDLQILQRLVQLVGGVFRLMVSVVEFGVVSMLRAEVYVLQVHVEGQVFELPTFLLV